LLLLELVGLVLLEVEVYDEEVVVDDEDVVVDDEVLVVVLTHVLTLALYVYPVGHLV
jgi:hypothetical protein